MIIGATNTLSSINRSHLCPLSIKQRMNYYLSPEDAPWTEEYRDAQRVINSTRIHGDNHSRHWCDENSEEFSDALLGVI